MADNRRQPDKAPPVSLDCPDRSGSFCAVLLEAGPPRLCRLLHRRNTGKTPVTTCFSPGLEGAPTMNRIFEPRGYFRVPDGTLVSPFLNATDSTHEGLPWGFLGDLSIASGLIGAKVHSQVFVHL